MSGEPPVLLPGAAMVGLVRAADALSRAGLARYAVIGGVAVSVRLGQVHRATADVDALVDDGVPPDAIEALLAQPGAALDPSGSHRVLIDGVKVEIQHVAAVTDDELDGLSDQQILYVGAHAWALATAVPLTLTASDLPRVSATVPVATPAALVAMKLHAIGDRRPGGAQVKRAGDAWDIYNLLLAFDGRGDLRADLSTTHPRLRAVIGAAARSVLVDDAARTRAWLRAGDERMRSVTAEELMALGEPVVRALLDDPR